jgi:uncharacterized membrane protein
LSTLPGRIRALDRLRGLLVVLMAPDHANYFVAQAHSSGEYWGGAFPAYTTAAAFLSRLITHPAAPGFFFLMRSGAALLAARRAEEGWEPSRIRRHLLMRGALLVVIQLLVYGCTPLFFYVLHLFLYAGIGRLFAPRGTSFGWMLLYWLLGLAALYPLCVGFRELKRRCSSASPLRLF